MSDKIKNFPSKGGWGGSRNLGIVPKFCLVINYDGLPKYSVRHILSKKKILLYFELGIVYEIKSWPGSNRIYNPILSSTSPASVIPGKETRLSFSPLTHGQCP